MNQKLIMAFFNSGSFYSLDCRATDNAVAKLESPWESRVQFLGSVNGVLLLDLRIGDQLCIWNPAIRRYQKFLQPKYRARDIPLYGIGYDSISDDFKVVRVTSFMNNQARDYDFFTMGDPPYAVHVFSSKLSWWKRIGDFGYSTHEYGVKESWTKLFVVPYVPEGDFYFDYFKLLGYPKDGEVLMLLNSSHLKLSSNKLVIYEIKQNKYKTIEMPDNSEWWVVDAYVQSLVSPYGCAMTLDCAMTLEGTADQMAIEEKVYYCFSHGAR
ncbi:hypothetical protein Vadar_027983 [Vaccinium darrowii]|uniref:Uncharacterized protein n=1 Tax=Vaccinium darrowii TaxID=229202 RepID=A0ACB7XTR2_9ERIC|nr:hypothetical protein Vadar_027983 [Vaccinium darrowii]